MLGQNTISNSVPSVGTIPTPPSFPKKVSINGQGGTQFSEMFKSFLQDVNHMQNHAGESIQRMVAGEIKDPHQVMLAVGEAKMALNLLIEVRNKVMEGYKEIINIRV